MQDKILVINQNNAQTQVIVRALRQEQIFAQIVDSSITIAQIKEEDPMGLIVSGSAGNGDSIPFNEKWLLAGLPVLALGDAALSLLETLGGTFDAPLPSGIHAITCGTSPILANWYQSDRYLSNVHPLILPECLQCSAQVGEACIGFHHQSLPLFGMQIQMEQNDVDIAQLLAAFAIDVCLCSKWWDSDVIIRQATAAIKERVGDGTALLALTGGVDSGVCSLLAYAALGNRLKCYLVDTGLLPQADLTDTLDFFRDERGIEVKVIDAKQRFLAALEGIGDKAEKAERIHRLLETIQCEQKETMQPDWLIRATNCQDMLSGAIPEQDALFGQHVIDPIAQLFKDEVRHLGEMLGLAPAIVSRQPFPETGFALRVNGEINAQHLQVLRDASHIFQSEIKQSGQDRKLWQYFAVLMPLAHGYIVVMRAVNAIEGGRRYDAARLPVDLTERVTKRILEEVPLVLRVLYDFTPAKRWQDIEWP